MIVNFNTFDYILMQDILCSNIYGEYHWRELVGGAAKLYIILSILSTQVF